MTAYVKVSEWLKLKKEIVNSRRSMSAFGFAEMERHSSKGRIFEPSKK